MDKREMLKRYGQCCQSRAALGTDWYERENGLGSA